jgi:hypothetical protein
MDFWEYLLVYTVVFPILFGLYRFKQLDLTFRILLLDLIFGLIREIAFDYVHGPQAKHLFQILFAIQNISFTYYAFLIWGQKKQPFKKTIYLLLLLSISFFAESLIGKTNPFQYSLVDPAAYLLLVFFLLDCLAFVLKNTRDKKQKTWITILLITLSISNMHYVLFNILSYFFYNEKNADFFLSLFMVNMILYTLTNLIFAFLFIWYPQKQQYLQHSSS